MTPAEQLQGIDLGNGWTVGTPIGRKPNATGGHFSKGYLCEHINGQRGFLKALDYTAAMRSPDPAGVLQAMTTAYNFEKAICDKTRHLSRVARALASGSVAVKQDDPFSTVQYLIFELAQGDVRNHLDAMSSLDFAFIFRTLHNVATGISQLHSANIAHQDLKPSNVLIYTEGAASKICDLGRAWDKNHSAPHDNLVVAGDTTYAPPELQYNHIPADHRKRRFGCDLYHLGSLVVFLFTRTHTNALLHDALSPQHRSFFWGGTFREVLPYLQASFEIALNKFANQTPQFARQELRSIVYELCNPDDSERGHPKNRHSNQHSLERYISRFDILAHKARLDLVPRRED